VNCIYTVGHSTRTQRELFEVIHSFEVHLLVDIRSVPRSSYNPQFDSKVLSLAASRERVRYLHMPKLGGLRRPRIDSHNDAWRNEGFRGYADYMETEEFDTALDELCDLANGNTTCIMCAEAVPWRCHRSLVSDALVARGHSVEHITACGRASEHRIAPFARVTNEHVTYPAPH
jgi:uncharacterized protein (DUF488 family)